MSGVNLNNFTSNVANGRTLINEHYDAQLILLNPYVNELDSRPEKLDDDNETEFDPISMKSKIASPELKKYAKAFRAKAIDEMNRVKDINMKHCETLWSSSETDLGSKFGVRLKHNESVFDKSNKSPVSKLELIKRELFSKSFCFVLNLAPVRDMYRLKIDFILVVIEFYLNPTQICILQNRINRTRSEQLITLDERYLQIDLILNEVQEQLQVFKESRNLEFFDEIMRIKTDKLKSLKEICFVREDIRGINFEDNNLSFPKLKLMDLSSNMIEHLSESIFNRMPNLEYIDLSSNQLSLEGQEIHVFKGVKNCRFLYISKNPIYKLDSSFFNYMRNLEDLAISELCLPDLNGSMFFYLKDLKKLNASSNRIRTLDKNTFLGLTQLTQLCLSSNQIDRIEPDTFLNLSGTLKVLRLGDNLLAKVETNWIASLVNLEELELQNNKIASIEPDSFTGMANLKLLNLGGNSIRDFTPSTLASLKNLTTLRLERNGFQKLDNGLFANLANLEMLCLNRNEFVDLDENVFQGLGNLKTLDLSHNKLNRFNVKILEMTKKLKILVLIYNPIGNYPELEDLLEKHDIRIVDENF